MRLFVFSLFVSHPILLPLSVTYDNRKGFCGNKYNYLNVAISCFFPLAIYRMTMYYRRVDQSMISQCVGVYMKFISKGNPLFVLSLLNIHDKRCTFNTTDLKF